MALGVERLAAALCCYRRRFSPEAAPEGDVVNRCVDSEEAVMSSAAVRAGAGARSGCEHGAPYYPSASSDGASDGTPSEEHPEFVEICVVLPDGSTRPVTVEYGKQMMDLLVQVAAGNKLSPASHTIHVFDEDSGRQVEYKASQSVGSLRATTLHLVSKKNDKRKADRPKSVQPFVKTQRLTVNLPRNQKFVTRVNPKLTLADIYKMVCTEKKLDPYKYDLRHPTHPDHALNMAESLGTYGISEIFVVSITASESRAAADLSLTSAEVESSATMPRLSRKSPSSGAADEGATSYMPGQDGEKKKKKSFLSFLSKKKAGSFKLGATSSHDPVYAQSSSLDTHVPQVVVPSATSPAQSKSTRSLSAGSDVSGAHSPPPSQEGVTVTHSQTLGIQKVVSSRRKRAAPAPPPISSQSGSGRAAPTPPTPTTPNALTPASPTNLNHSRNSSHSSGFDESNVSPIESPGTSTRTDVSAKTITSIDVTSIESSAVEGQRQSPQQPQRRQQTRQIERRMVKSQSLPMSAAPKLASVRPQSQLITSASLNTLRRKKRKAPAPPPPSGALKSRPTPTPVPDIGGATSTHEHVEVVTSAQGVTTSFDEADAATPTSMVQEDHQLTKHAELVNGFDGILEGATMISTTAVEENDAPLAEITKEGEFSFPSITNETMVSVGTDDGDDLTSDGSSVQAYVVNTEMDVVDGEEKKDEEKAASDDEDLPSYPTDPEGIVLIKKTSISEFHIDNVLAHEKAKKEINEDTIRSSFEIEVQDDATVVAVGGDTSDSGHSSGAMEKSDETSGDVLENEITFDDDEVLYVEPLNPGNPVAKEEYLNQVEQERIESAAVAEELERQLKVREVAAEEEQRQRESALEEEDMIQLKLQRAREAAARASEVYEQTKTPVKSPVQDGPLTTSTPMVQSISSSVASTDDSTFIRSPSPVLPMAKEEEVAEKVVEKVEKTRQQRRSESLSEEGDVFANPTEVVFAVNDYRITGIIKEELIEFSFPENIKPIEQSKKEEEEPLAIPMVTSLRQRYTKRPILPREPLDVSDMESMGLLTPNVELLPPPEGAAPPIPSEPPEPLVICQDTRKPVDETEKIYIKPAQESMTDPDDDIVIEVTEISSPAWGNDSSELSIPNEADPEILEHDKAFLSSHRTLRTEDTEEHKPTGILKHSSSYDSSSTPVPTKSILKSPSVDYEQEKPAGILKKETSGRVYSSMTSLNTSDWQGATNKPYASSTNLSSAILTCNEMDGVSPVKKPSLKYAKRGLGVYGPRPWGASRYKIDTDIQEDINTKFSDRYNNNDPTVKGGNVRQRMGELGFSPGTETEKENVLEEKSLSMMNLKTIHTSVGGDHSSLRWLKKKDSVSRSTEEVAQPQLSSGISPDGSEESKSLQTQYEELQKQFNRWQKQLQDNQALLTQKNIQQKEELVQHAPVELTSTAPFHSTLKPVLPSPAAASSTPVYRHVDARYEPPIKTTPDTGGGGRFTTNDLLLARSRLRSSSVDEDNEIEKCGVTVGRIVDTVPSLGMVSSIGDFVSPVAAPPPSLPQTSAPDTKGFPPPPRRVLIQPPTPTNMGPPHFESKLDPREELMITIRNSGGRTALRKVPVNQTKWYSGAQPPEK